MLTIINSEITDTEVANSYIDSVKPNGEIFQYPGTSISLYY